MSDLSSALALMAQKLASIGTVRMGRAALSSTGATLPSLTLWGTEDKPADDNGYKRNAYTRSLILEIQIEASESYHDALDTVLSQVRLALRPLVSGPALPVALALRETGARFFEPADGGDYAVVQIGYDIDYIDRT